ncbi:MAG: hypothetical protein OEY23_01470 [Acidimicrobiia bacterium]|nr:hypothetical protein [Acidimicrobiia bacterium]
MANTGDVDLRNVVLSDPTHAQCDTVIGTLATGATAAPIACVVTTISETTTNVATVRGLGGTRTVSATADATVTVDTPAVQVMKFVNGADAEEPPGPALPVGSDVTFTFTVTNVGSTPLTDIVVLDDTLGRVGCDKAALEVGEFTFCTPITTPALEGPHANVVSVQATSPAGLTVRDTDRGHYTGVSVAPPDPDPEPEPEPEPKPEPAPCPSDGLLHGLRFEVNGGEQVAEQLYDLTVRSGDVVTMRWDRYADGGEGCEVSLALYKAHAEAFSPDDDQTLLESQRCVPGTSLDCAAPAGGFEISIAVPSLGEPCPIQIDAVTGTPLAVVGPSGGYYSSRLTGGTNRLVSYLYQALPAGDGLDPASIH